MSTVSVIGNINVDILAAPVSELPPPGTDLPVESMEVRTAGAAGNTALAMAALGSAPRLVGCVGDDHLGDLLLRDLRDAGMVEDISVIPNQPTGISVAFEAPGRDRSFLTLLGCLEGFDASMVPEGALATDFVLLCGYFNLPAFRGESTIRLVKEARSRGALILLDTGWDPGGWSAATREEISELLPLIDVFLPNETEACHLADLRDPQEAAHALQELSGNRVVVKLGPDGCLCAGPKESFTVAAPSVQITDTTGAGDAFNGGLLHAISRDAAWPEALDFATQLASTVVSRPSKNRYPSMDDLISLPST